MKKTITKLLSLILCLCCVFSMSFIVACDNTGDTNSNSLSNSTPTSEDESQTVSTKEVTSFVCSDVNANKYFFVGEDFVPGTLSVVAKYADNTQKGLQAGSYKVSANFTKDSPIGKYQVSVELGELAPYTYDVYVMDKPVVENNLIKLYIDSSFTGFMGSNVGGKITFAKINDAIGLLTAMKLGSEIKKEVYISAGTYKEKINISKSVANVSFIGESSATTKLTYDDYAAKTGTDLSASVTIKGESFTAKNITFENSFDYINLASTVGNSQALAILVDTDKCSFYDCVFLGYQDTLEAKSGRQYYKNCTIKGTVDFIFGNNATALFDSCDIVSRYTAENKSNNGYLTAQKGNTGKNVGIPSIGYVFKNCNITAETGVGAQTVSLGRPWRANATVAYLDCTMGSHISKRTYGGESKPRYDSMEGDGLNLPENANFVEYGNTGEGAVSETEYTSLSFKDYKYLSAQEYANYTSANIFAKVNGMVTYVGDWNPVA